MYNTPDCLTNFIRSICISASAHRERITCVVADNSNTQIPEEKWRALVEYAKEKVALRYLKNSNIGYFPAIQRALSDIDVNISDYEYLISSNVDVAVKEDFFEQLSKIILPDTAGVLAPAIFNYDTKANVNPKLKKRPSRRKLLANKFLFSSMQGYSLVRVIYNIRIAMRTEATALIKNYRKAAEIGDGNNNYETIYAPHGSFIIFRPSLIDVMEVFKYPIRLFGEEIHLGELARLRGCEIVYMPCLEVNDWPHASTGLMPTQGYLEMNKVALQYLLETYFRE